MLLGSTVQQALLFYLVVLHMLAQLAHIALLQHHHQWHVQQEHTIHQQELAKSLSAICAQVDLIVLLEPLIQLVYVQQDITALQGALVQLRLPVRLVATVT